MRSYLSCKRPVTANLKRVLESHVAHFLGETKRTYALCGCGTDPTLPGAYFPSSRSDKTAVLGSGSARLSEWRLTVL